MIGNPASYIAKRVGEPVPVDINDPAEGGVFFRINPKEGDETTDVYGWCNAAMRMRDAVASVLVYQFERVGKGKPKITRALRFRERHEGDGEPFEDNVVDVLVTGAKRSNLRAIPTRLAITPQMLGVRPDDLYVEPKRTLGAALQRIPEVPREVVFTKPPPPLRVQATPSSASPIFPQPEPDRLDLIRERARALAEKTRTRN